MKQLALLLVFSTGVAHADPREFPVRDLHLDPAEGWGVQSLEDMNPGGTCDCDSPEKPAKGIPPAKAALFTLETDGGVDEKIVRRDIERLQPALARCYELGDTRHGRNILQVSLSIGPNGVVSDGMTTGVRDVVADCAYDELASVTFPRPTGDAAIVATFKMEPDYAQPLQKNVPARPAVKVKIAKVTVSGGLDETIASHYMHRRSYAVADCYASARMIRPRLAGTLTGVLAFDANGHVRRAAWTGAGGRLLHSCAERAFAPLDIPKPASEGELTVTMTLGR